MTVKDSVAAVMDRAADQLRDQAATLRRRPLMSLVDSPRFLLLAGPLLTAILEVDREAVRITGYTIDPALLEAKA